MYANHLSPVNLKSAAQFAPSVFSKTPAPDRTDRYALVHTPDVIAAMGDRGFVPVSIQADKPTRRDPRYVRHMVRFAHEDYIGSGVKPSVGDIAPQVLFWNSHNGRTKARMCGGYYRFVCSNGLVVGHEVNTYAFTHTGDAIWDQVKKALGVVDETLAYGAERVERFNKVKLDDNRIATFTERAMALRFGDTAGSYDASVVQTPAREEDQGNVLWNVFNRVQENLTRGELSGVNANGRRVRSRPLTGITTDLSFNQGLWQLMEEYADAA